MRKYHFRQDILIAESYMKFAVIWTNKIDKRKQAANRLTYASCECCSKNSTAKNIDQHCIKYHIFDILPRLKPWESLDSGSVIQPYRLKYSHCVQDLC